MLHNFNSNSRGVYQNFSDELWHISDYLPTVGLLLRFSILRIT